MSSTCIKKHFPTLETRFKDLVNLPMGEKEATIKATIEEYERLQEELNNFKKTIGVKEEVYKTIDNSKEIQEITEDYSKLIENVAPIVKEAPIKEVVEITLVEEDTYQKEIDKINKDFDKKINDLKPQDELNTVAEYKKRVENLLKTLYTDIQNIPKNSDDISQEKPTKEEIEKYRGLRKNNKQKKVLI